jgi:hypothetical protein
MAKLAGLDLGKIENVVDDDQQRIGRRLDGLYVLALFAVQVGARASVRTCP